MFPEAIRRRELSSPSWDLSLGCSGMLKSDVFIAYKSEDLNLNGSTLISLTTFSCFCMGYDYWTSRCRQITIFANPMRIIIKNVLNWRATNCQNHFPERAAVNESHRNNRDNQGPWCRLFSKWCACGSHSQWHLLALSTMTNESRGLRTGSARLVRSLKM